MECCHRAWFLKGNDARRFYKRKLFLTNNTSWCTFILGNQNIFLMYGSFKQRRKGDDYFRKWLSFYKEAAFIVSIALIFLIIFAIGYYRKKPTERQIVFIFYRIIFVIVVIPAILITIFPQIADKEEIKLIALVAVPIALILVTIDAGSIVISEIFFKARKKGKLQYCLFWLYAVYPPKPPCMVSERKWCTEVL